MLKLFFRLLPFAAIGVAACDSGMSTTEIERAAIDRARQELQLAADAPLEARVWIGQEVDGDITYCGTVSGGDGAGPAIVPQRFVALSDPLRFEVFEPAHRPMVTTQPDMFRSWEQLCAER